MSWVLRVWWSYSDRDRYRLTILESRDADVTEEFDTKAEAEARAEEILENGYTISSPGMHDHLPAAGITHVSIYEGGQS